MRSVLVHEGYVEEDVKPADLLAEFRRLTEADVRSRLSARDLVARPCPGCGGKAISDRGERFGLAYVACRTCGTLRVDPVPDDDAILAYYRESDAEAFWRHELSRLTSDTRRARIVEPRMAWISDAVAEHAPNARTLIDVHTNYSAYIPALVGLPQFDRVALARPMLPANEIPEVPPIEIVDWPDSLRLGDVDAVTLFEALDRTADNEALMRHVAAALKPGGLCFVTGILASGLEFQIFGLRAPNLLPPDRLNVFTVEGLQTLAARHGFEILEFSTPGNFDVRTVDEARKTLTEVSVPPFIDYLLDRRSDADKLRFQEFLQSALLSAYGRVVLKKI